MTEIRKAVKADCKEIRRLIQELADYEKMPDGPKIDEKALEEHGFGDRPFFECNVMEDSTDSSKLVGFVLYFFTYSTWEGPCVFMEDLYVTPSHRGKGIGTKLWQSVVKAGLEKKCVRCNFCVLDWNKPSIEFYQSKGAVDLTAKEGWHDFRMHAEQMKKFVEN